MNKKQVFVWCTFFVACIVGAILFFWEKGKLKDETKSKESEYRNVWIQQAKDDKATIFFEGKTSEYSLKGLEKEIYGQVADIIVKGNQITKISLKKEKIEGKVLSIDESGVDVQGYGRVPFDTDFVVYKTYGDLEMRQIKDIVVGYDVQTFVVANGKICAAFIYNPVEAKNIRVLIKNSGYSNLFHSSVKVTCDGAFRITYDGQKKRFRAGKTITIKSDSKYLQAGRLVIKPVNKTDKIQILSVDRECGNPKYRGNIEIVKREEGLLLINELSLEKYLYAVLPSEMPVSYGVESLKVQAVCARSYAYRHLLDNSYSEYGAHVDDSTSYQVYNNFEECEESIAAVNATKGEILVHNDEVIAAYFFSTSCGSTTSGKIWNLDAPYLKNTILSDKKSDLDLSDEKTFDSFIRNDFDAYDKHAGWFRWKVSFSLQELEDHINRVIGDRYSKVPDKILTQNKDGEFVSEPISSIGTLERIGLVKRGDGGVLEEVVLFGSEKTVKICQEYNIRYLINSPGIEVTLQDGNKSKIPDLLPSAYFVIDREEKDGKLTGYTIIGGGYGHGIGMSQNAVKGMVEADMKYQEILKFFYDGITISTY